MKEGTILRIAGITKENLNELRAKIIDLESQGVATAEIYRRLTAGKGRPSTHVSGMQDKQTLKSGIITVSKRKRTK